MTLTPEDAPPEPADDAVSSPSAPALAEPRQDPAAPAGDRARADMRGKAEGAALAQPEGEAGGPTGPEPTRYGDWEKGGRCFDF